MELKRELYFIFGIVMLMFVGYCLGWELRDNQDRVLWDFKYEPPTNSEPSRVIKLEIYKRDIVYIDDTDKTLSFVVKSGVYYNRITDSFLFPDGNEVAAQGEIVIDFGEWQEDN